MKKKLIIVTVSVLAVGSLMSFRIIKHLFSNKQLAVAKPSNIMAKGSFYDFKLKSLDGKETIDFAKYKGKKIVVLNTASECGYTPQYADWQKFHEKYGDKIVVLGVPANNFGGQEPGSNKEIATFCQKNYGVTFQMLEKISVVGNDQHPLYQWLSKKDMNGWNDKAPTWNFCKYVINEKGEVANFFASGVKPDSPEFKKAVGL
ncbi:glutathione peroxidase [Emticicia oligotrophica DSM 17448]|uniref:Glutathione peroxidase n=1 Tax=Emticicia oligotrophica (strain DSM 17448 / CIP 109782 / MTCC 6937 / GPTSA100-15) TaxID=929562 RepID=A0ABM5N542_EMTOG|nr:MULTISPECIES: glutathione peroxidase [Emticicia]AFK04635.1 glutathione peroxidase [Emticicia oligotrophica DSM 17448]